MEQEENQKYRPNKFKWWWVFFPVSRRTYFTDSKSEISWWMFFVNPILWIMPWAFFKNRKTTTSDWINIAVMILLLIFAIVISYLLLFMK